MKHKILFILAATLIVHRLEAQESRSLTLGEAIDLSIKNSKQLKVNEARINEAVSAIHEAEEKRLPDAGISTSYLYLPFSPNIHYSNDTSSKRNSPKISQVIYGMASVSVPVYSGGKLRYGIESAKYLEQATRLDAESDRTALIMNTISACVNLFKAKEAIELYKENLEESIQRLKDLSSLEKNGLLARNELLKASLQKSDVELELLDAQSNYTLACVNMNLMMGLPEQTILIPDKSGLELPDSIKTINAYEQDALNRRNDIAAVSIRKKAAETGLKSVKANAYPNIALTGGYIAADLPGYLSITNAINVGLGIKYNLSSIWKNKTSIQQSEAKIKEIALGKEILNDQVRLQVNQAYQHYLVCKKKIEVYLSAVEQATENYRITKNKYNNSLATTTELLDADVALLKSKLYVTDAKADAFLAYKRILYTSGLLTN